MAHLGSAAIALDREVYAPWAEFGAAGAVANYLEGNGRVIYLAAGITDPKQPLDEHLRINLMLPQNVIKGAAQCGVRVITFGSIMERIVGADDPNPYLASKRRLSEHILSLSEAADVLHLQIHTLYGGGAPHRYMFLGQLLHAIRHGERFRMSAGSQLREYHHVDDEILAIGKAVASGTTGTLDISHGAPVRLCDLARYVCEQFGCRNRPEIGAIASAHSENFDKVFERPAMLREIAFRDTFDGIVQDLKLYCKVN